MKQLTLYDRYKRNVLAEGGKLKDVTEGQMGAVAGLALMGGQAMGDGPSMGKGALTGLGTGMSIGKNFGPMGAAIGAGAGLLIGGIKGGLDAKKLREEEEQANIVMKTRTDLMDMNRSGSRLAGDPSLATGTIGAGYFAMGGAMIDPTKPYDIVTNPDGYTEMDSFNGKKLATPGFKANKSLYSYMNTPAGNDKYKYNGVVAPNGKQINLPTPQQSIWTMGNYLKRNKTEFDVHPSGLRNGQTFPQSITIDRKAPLVTAANGGSIAAPLSTLMMNGGSAKSLSKNNTELVGASHAQGGIDIPSIGAEVEGKETTMDDYVFSDKLGFAAIHKPIALAKGKIEEKPATKERMNSLRMLMGKENALKQQQEMVKQQLNLS